MRKRIIECVVATDMTMHQDQVHYLKQALDRHKVSGPEVFIKELEGSKDSERFGKQQETLNLMIHAADLSN